MCGGAERRRRPAIPRQCVCALWYCLIPPCSFPSGLTTGRGGIWCVAVPQGVCEVVHAFPPSPDHSPRRAAPPPLFHLRSRRLRSDLSDDPAEPTLPHPALLLSAAAQPAVAIPVAAQPAVAVPTAAKPAITVYTSLTIAAFEASAADASSATNSASPRPRFHPIRRRHRPLR